MQESSVEPILNSSCLNFASLADSAVARGPPNEVQGRGRGSEWAESKVLRGPRLLFRALQGSSSPVIHIMQLNMVVRPHPVQA